MTRLGVRTSESGGGAGSRCVLRGDCSATRTQETAVRMVTRIASAATPILTHIRRPVARFMLLTAVVT